MQLLVIRHAIAALPRPQEDDAARPLTRKGRRRFRRAVSGLAALALAPGRVLHSPWTRAAATADLLRPLLEDDEALEPTDLLCQPPGPALLEAIAAASAHLPSPETAVAVVGHEPFLGELIGLLTTGSSASGESLQLKKGSVCLLRGSPVSGGMTLCALLPPRVLRELGR